MPTQFDPMNYTNMPNNMPTQFDPMNYTNMPNNMPTQFDPMNYTNMPNNMPTMYNPPVSTPTSPPQMSGGDTEGDFFCDFIASTNMHKLAPEWECDAGTVTMRPMPLTPPCGTAALMWNDTWGGVRCNADGHVIALDARDLPPFDDYVIKGKMPSSIKNLMMLEVIEAAHQKFKGLIPAEIGELKHLKTLNLGHNKFAGECRHDAILFIFYCTDLFLCVLYYRAYSKKPWFHA